MSQSLINQTGPGTLQAGSASCKSDAIAAAALNAVGIRTKGSFGGSLGNMDIQNMEVGTAIKLSMLQGSLGGGYRDLVIDRNNNGKIVNTGGGGGTITDVYYTISSQARLPQKVSTVTIVGYDPLPYRVQGVPQNILSGADDIEDMNQMLSNCNKYNFVQWASKIYKEPLSSAGSANSVGNVYSWCGAYENIIGWVYKLDGSIPETAVVSHNGTTAVPVKLPSADTGPRFVKGTAEDPSCAGPDDCEGGITVPVPSLAKYSASGSGWNTDYNGFLGIKKVILIGTVLDEVFSAPSSAGSTDTPKYYATINDSSDKAIALSEGQDYAVKYPSQRTAEICFADNKSPKDPGYYSAPISLETNPWSGAAKPGQVYNAANVFLTSANQGVIIKEIWVVCDMDVPSLTVYDKAGQAQSILNSIQYTVKALKVYDAPAPMAVNGNLVEQTEEGSPADQAASAQNSGGAGQGVSLTLPFLSASGCITMSTYLKNLMSEGGGTASEKTYICGPRCNPGLGSGSASGTINKITHSYSDQGTYTVSVTTGPAFRGDVLATGGSAPTPYAVESISTKGSVTHVSGSSVSVRVDGYGTVSALNCQREFLRPGDRVQVTLHNNPVN